MIRNAIISIVLHIVVITVAYVGLPAFTDVAEMQDVPITVEIVTVSDQTNLPTKPKEPEPEAKPTPKPPPKPPAPPPAPQGAVEPPPPAPAPEPEPAPENVAVITQPEVKPKKEAKPKPKPEPEPKKTASKKLSPAKLPPRKPAPPDEFQSVLKTLEDLKAAPRTEEKPDEKAPERDFASMMENALESDRPRRDIGPDLTISEIDLVRRQIQRCWNLPAGAKDAHTMLISISAQMNADGTVRTAKILDNARMGNDPFYRTMAESALRAVLNPVCQPFKLPPEKYERWKDLKLNFDPKEMFGL